MNPELPDQVDELYKDHDRLVLDALQRIAHKAEAPDVDPVAVSYWENRRKDAQKAVDYAQQQLDRLTQLY